MSPDDGQSVESGDTRLGAARCLGVVQRTVAWGLRCEASTRTLRFLDHTCRPWLDRIEPAGLEAGEAQAVEDLRGWLSRWDDGLSLGARHDILSAMARDLDTLSGLLDRPIPPPSPRGLVLGLEVAPPGPREPGRRTPSPPAPVAPSSPAVPPPAAVIPPAVPRPPEGGRPATPDPGHAAAREPEQEPVLPPAPPVATASLETPHGPAERQPSPAALPENEGRAASPSSAESGGGNRRGRRHDRRRVPAEPPPPEPVEEEVVVPEDPTRCLSLHDPEGAGRTLEDWGRVPDALREPLEAAGIHTVADLLLRGPVRYELLPRAISPAEPFVDGGALVIRGTIRRRVTRLTSLGRRFEVVLTDGGADLVCRWVTPVDEAFRQRFAPGARVAVHGVVEHDGDVPLLLEGEPVWLDSRGQGRQACYDIPGITEPEMRSLQRMALDDFSDTVLDPLPDSMRQSVRLLDLGEALRRLHFPTMSLRRGRERLAFDELLLYQLGMGLRRRRTPQERGIVHAVSHKLVSQLQMANPLQLNDDQETAFSEIRRDLARSRPMNRLLQGEVGAGKGVLAMLSAVMVAEARDQVVFITPDALAAEHRYVFAEPLLRSVGLVPALITDRPTAAQADALRRGEVHVVIGTPRLTRPWPEFKRLGLVVVEERSEYGEISLNDLPSRGGRPDLLHLTAAPIPPSLTLTVFGSMDLSQIGGAGVGTARCEVFAADQRIDAYARARAELEAGRQVYVVFPLRGEETLDQKDLARVVDALRTDAFPGARIGVFSGVKSREERQRVFTDFRHRRLDVLLTTTIIEDGPRVGTATAMIVESADVFDLIRLHRLRAHVGRGVRTGLCCFILSNQPEPQGQTNVELICRETEGFRIAEVDLLQRGAGAVLGGRAREVPSFRYMDPLEHRELLVRARSEAFELLAGDPALAAPHLQALRLELGESWERWFPGKPVLAKGKKPAAQSRQGGARRRRRRGTR